VPVNLRVIAATHCPLEALVREGRFRDDLYYRLNGARFMLPPLRERTDLAWLAQRMLADAPAGQPAPRWSEPALAALRAHRWPGNLRELRNVADYARSVCNDGVVQVSDLPDALGLALPTTPPPAAPTLATPTDAGLNGAAELRRQLLGAHWNVSALARALGCSRMTLYRRMKRLGIRSPLHDASH
jgi:transcriptional regulator of acetoin/glycerol metabolism